jgi:hypothetical protein
VTTVNDRNKRQGESMSTSPIDSANGGALETAEVPAKGKGERKAKKAKPAKKAAAPKKHVSKLKADRVNKKADVVAMMKRARGASSTLGIAPCAGRLDPRGVSDHHDRFTAGVW